MTLRTLLLAATALTTVNTLGLASTANAQSLSFAPVSFAADDAAKRAVTGTTAAMIDGVEAPMAWHTILRTGDKAGDGIYGDLITNEGKAIGKVSAN